MGATDADGDGIIGAAIVTGLLQIVLAVLRRKWEKENSVMTFGHVLNGRN